MQTPLQNKEEVPGKNYSKQKLLLGTHTSEEEQNHLLLAEVHLPTEDSELSSAQYDEESAEIGGYGASPGDCSSPLSALLSLHTPVSFCMPCSIVYSA